MTNFNTNWTQTQTGNSQLIVVWDFRNWQPIENEPRPSSFLYEPPGLSQEMSKYPGVEVSSSFSLAEPDEKPIADVNGYYYVLGLTEAYVLSIFEDIQKVKPKLTIKDIKRAYRKLVKKHHPDRGSKPDPHLWEWATCAHEVLSDPVTKEVYDSLVPPQLWVDHRVLTEIKKNIPPENSPEGRAIREKLEREAQQVQGRYSQSNVDSGNNAPGSTTSDNGNTDSHSVSSSLEYQFYYDQDVEPPSQEKVRKWAEYLSYAFHCLGHKQPVKLGFTTGRWRVERPYWGDVIVVPVHLVPDKELAAYFVSKSLEPVLDWYRRFIAIRKEHLISEGRLPTIQLGHRP